MCIITHIMKKLSIKEKTSILILKYMSKGLSMTTAMECADIAIDEIKAVIDDSLQGFLDTDVMVSLNQMKEEIKELRSDIHKNK